jgi:hypothetical protein
MCSLVPESQKLRSGRKHLYGVSIDRNAMDGEAQSQSMGKLVTRARPNIRLLQPKNDSTNY